MGRDLYTNGEIVIANTAVDGILAAVGSLADNEDPITTIEDLADHLYELAAGSPYDDDPSPDHDGVSVDAGDTDTIIGITVNDGRMQIDQWQTIMSLLAQHGATGSFFHEEEDGTHGDQYRPRLDDRSAYTEPRLDYIFKNDIVAYVGHMQRAPRQSLDFITVKAHQHDVITALLDELRTRHASAPTAGARGQQAFAEWPESTGRSIRSQHRSPRHRYHGPRQLNLRIRDRPGSCGPVPRAVTPGHQESARRSSARRFHIRGEAARTRVGSPCPKSSSWRNHEGTAMHLTPNDPPGRRFDSWAAPGPEGEWHYILDDFGIVYGPGWWPFYRHRTPPGEPTRSERAAVRVAPDTACQSWRNEYVLLWPPRNHGAQTRCTLTLFVRTQGLGAVVADTTVTLDPKRATATVADTCPPQLREQADTKAARLLQFTLEHRRNRRRGHLRPDTAHARWQRNRDRADPSQNP